MNLQFFGGRGALSGKIASDKKGKPVRRIDGINTYFDSYINVSKSSPNDLWAENTSKPHMQIKYKGKAIHLQGDKKDKYALLENVNTAVVHLQGVSNGDPKREVNRLNKQLKDIESRGFRIWSAYAGSDETLVYVKRKLFTRQY